VPSDYRDELVAQRTAEANRRHADLAIVCPGSARHCRALSSAHALHTTAQLVEQARTGSMHAQLAQRRILRLQQLDEQLAACGTQLTKLVTATRTRLGRHGRDRPAAGGPHPGEVGDVHRFPTRPATSSPQPTAPPDPVSSGRTDRYRLNRGGNRRPNRAQYFAALTPGQPRPASGRLPGRKQAEGKTRREAPRCPKRRLSDVV
jgi:transposase